jgi:peroxiredoxin Q/BCP
MRTARAAILVLASALAATACTKEPAQNAASTTSTPAPPTPAESAPSATTAKAALAAPAAAEPLKVLSNVPDVVSGKAPPDFSAVAHDGTRIHLAELKGKPVALYFYPKDETPGCTKEACSFRDAWEQLSKKGVVLIGISGDTDASHKAFAEHHKLPFLLISDPKGELAKAFGVPFNDGYAGRQSFVIGADGNVKKVYRKVDVTVHAQEIAGDIT